MTYWLLCAIIEFSFPGSFLYIDMANPRRPNDIAELSYGRNYSGESYCLVFWYHMYGPSVNTLNVLVGNKTMWTRSGTHQDQWHEAYIALLFDYGYSKVIVVDEWKKNLYIMVVTMSAQLFSFFAITFKLVSL